MNFAPMDRSELWRPFDAGNISNPYPMYARLRAEDPVHHSQTGEWIISRYEDARNILRDTRFVVGNRMVKLNRIREFGKKQYDLDALKILKSFVLFLNGEEHSRLRKFILDVWGQREVQQLIENNLAQLLQIKPGPIDLVSSIARPLPSMTIGRILGLPPEDFAMLRTWGSRVVKALDIYISLKEVLQINDAAKAFVKYFQEYITKPRGNNSGLIDDLLEWNSREKTLSNPELLSTCVLLFIAGEETTSSLLGNGMLHLFSRPDVVSNLRKDQAKISEAVEEIIRYDSPVQILGRFASETCEVGTKEVQRGDTLTICLGSANRDGLQFEQPDELRLDRPNRKHLGFGGGAHYCIGDWLARTQASITFSTLLDRFEVDLVDTAPNWNHNLVIRSLSSLPANLRLR